MGTPSRDEWLGHLRAIRHAPDDDAPRLVCADWLMSLGDPRGELVALDCALARSSADDPKRAAMVGRRAALKDDQWLEPLLALGVDRPRLTRGFVDAAHLSGRFVANLQALMQLEPVTSLRFTSGGARGFAAAAQVAELAEIRALELDGRHPAGFEALLELPALAGLVRLAVHRVSHPAACAMAAGSARPASISFNHLTPADAELLAASRLLERTDVLSHLDPRGGDALLELVRAPLRSLRSITLVRPPGAALEALDARLDTLESADIAEATDDVLLALSRRPLTRLRSLALREPRFTARGFEGLAPWLETVEELVIGPGLLDGGVLQLIARSGAASLRRLELPSLGMELPDELLASSVLASVEELDISGSPLSERVVVGLMASPHLARLRRLVVPGISQSLRRQLHLPGIEIEG